MVGRLWISGLIASAALGQQPAELGTVAFGRDFPAAKMRALESKKPVALLFQEVPG